MASGVVGGLLIAGCGAPPDGPEVSDSPEVVDASNQVLPIAESDSILPIPPKLSDGTVGGMKLPDQADLKALEEKSDNEDSGSHSHFRLPDQPDSLGGNPPTDESAALPGAPSETSATGAIASWSEILSLASEDERVTIIDLWSLSCEPCMKAFPDLVELHQSAGDQVRCIAANLDFDGRKSRPPETYQRRVRVFLDQVQTTLSAETQPLEAFVCSTPSDEVYTAAGIVSLPAVLIFDRHGNPVRTYCDAGDTAGFNYRDDIVPLVRSLTAAR